MTTVYLGIGSNLGNKEANCERAISLLKESGVKVTTCSSPIETEPWGVEDQPRFINMVVQAETSLKPLELLGALKNIESQMGRAMTCAQLRWGPRVIDLDILLYGDTLLDSPELTVPHRHMHQRAFVLEPLLEIAPNLLHPVLNKTITQLLGDLHGL